MSRVAEAAQEVLQDLLNDNRSIVRVEVAHDVLVKAGFDSFESDMQGVREFASSVGFVYGDGFIWEPSTMSTGWSL